MTDPSVDKQAGESDRLPSVPLMHLNGPAALWWELPQADSDPAHGWLRLSIIHVLPDTIQAQWQPLDEEYTRRYAALYNEAKDEQAATLRQQHEARWNEFAAQQRDFHFFFDNLSAGLQFAAACLAQTRLALDGLSITPPLPAGNALLCPHLELAFGSETQRGGLFGLSRRSVATCDLVLLVNSEASATQHLNPLRVVNQAERLHASLTTLAAADPASLRDERAVSVVEQVIGVPSTA